MYSALATMEQSTNLLSSGSDSINPNRNRARSDRIGYGEKSPVIGNSYQGQYDDPRLCSVWRSKMLPREFSHLLVRKRPIFIQTIKLTLKSLIYETDQDRLQGNNIRFSLKARHHIHHLVLSRSKRIGFSLQRDHDLILSSRIIPHAPPTTKGPRFSREPFVVRLLARGLLVRGLCLMDSSRQPYQVAHHSTADRLGYLRPHKLESHHLQYDSKLNKGIAPKEP